MSLMPAKGQMYTWISHLKNYLNGSCPHGCIYCYVDDIKKKFPNVDKKYSGECKLIKEELNEDMGSGKTIFVQNNGDLFAKPIPKEWILEVLAHCNQYPDNVYLFQTKNPARFHEFIEIFPQRTILGTSLETNRDFKVSKAPIPADRALAMRNLNFEKMISIEPIMDFDLPVLIGWIKFIDPKFVSIGADSKNHNLAEPSKEKIEQLIKELEEFTEVKLKSNLSRLVEKND